MSDYGPLAFLVALVIPFIPQRAQSFAFGFLWLAVMAYIGMRSPALLSAVASGRALGGG